MVAFRTLLLLFLLASCSRKSVIEETPEIPDTMRYERGGEIAACDDEALDESSGICLSRRNKNLFWSHNDSGDAARLFAVDRWGKTRARCLLRHAQAVDWEDICSFTWRGKAYLAIGDIGDNYKMRDSRTIYIIEEPQVDGAWRQELVVDVVKTLHFKYEGGATDCESLAFDPQSGCFFLASKTAGRRAPERGSRGAGGGLRHP